MASSYLHLIQDGLPKTNHPQKIIIVGAGMAGLAAGYELLRAGHQVQFLEARQRAGGRVYTLREPFSEGLHAEAGAMRIPRTHDLTLAYIQKFGLRTAPFTMDNPQGYVYLHGKRYRRSEAIANPDQLEFGVKPDERGLSHIQLWENALQPLYDLLKADGETGWQEIVSRYDEYSTREFLEYNHWSEEAIEMFGLLADQEGIMNSSFLELFREEAGNYYTDMVYLEGGTDHLPRAFLPELQKHIHFGACLSAIEQSATDVTLHYRTSSGRWHISGDYAVLTTPFPVLRHIEVLQPFSRPKQRAIRQLHYDASSKIFMQFRRRFWEEDENIFGGGTHTDLPLRAVYYPDHGRETGRGVLLASYTWGEDAQRWGSLSPADRIQQALENLIQIHPQAEREFEVGASYMWHDDEFAGGAFALFDPEQQTTLYPYIVAPEGRVHFAGEHASLEHAWIQGAIESGLRAAQEINQRAQVA
jgi:monoamine oxidase